MLFESDNMITKSPSSEIIVPEVYGKLFKVADTLLSVQENVTLLLVMPPFSTPSKVPSGAVLSIVKVYVVELPFLSVRTITCSPLAFITVSFS